MTHIAKLRRVGSVCSIKSQKTGKKSDLLKSTALGILEIVRFYYYLMS